MAVFTNFLSFKKIFKLEKIFINHSKSLYTNTAPLIITSSRAERIFEDHLEKMCECNDDASKFKFGYNVVKEIFCDKEICINSLISERNRELIEYNLDGGRYKRVKVFLNTYENLVPKTKFLERPRLQAYVMACLNQLLLTSLMMIDDAIDDSKMRRNKPTWHNKVGRLICNDPFLLGTGVYTVMRNLFEKEPFYLPCLNVFYEIFWWGGCSVWLDYCSLDVLGRNAKFCNWDVHRTINTTEIGSTSFQAPLFSALHMAEYNFDSIRNELIEICALLGFIVKDQNDYCDRYSKTQGKTPDEDIRLGKLTWFILTALEQSDAEQKKILQECYGKDNPECMNAVINVYDQLHLEEKFFQHEEQLINYIVKRVEKISDEKMRRVLLDCLHTAENWYKD
ncbi:uncharacterized protein LOC135844558 [Planococcus citri]|uniref:uncharacterized protein LOC135844558 n=1 Tax=Planococcus citri TaxID=170843 RepID=UPI0031F7B47E